jgi:hypothetical protein
MNTPLYYKIKDWNKRPHKLKTERPYVSINPEEFFEWCKIPNEPFRFPALLRMDCLSIALLNRGRVWADPMKVQEFINRGRSQQQIEEEAKTSGTVSLEPLVKCGFLIPVYSTKGSK